MLFNSITGGANFDKIYISKYFLELLFVKRFEPKVFSLAVSTVLIVSRCFILSLISFFV